jgi:hypothetical protein
MKRSLQRRIEAVAKKIYAAEPRPRCLWHEAGETNEQIRERVRDMIASGEASPNDRFYAFCWAPPAGEDVTTDPRST